MDATSLVIVAVVAAVPLVGAVFLAMFLIGAQREMSGRIAQIAESTAANQADLRRTLDERLDGVTRRLGEGLEQSATRTAETLGDLKKHLDVLDAAQKNITELSGHVVGLQDILANKQARGAFGEIQLHDLVQSALPPSAYEFQATLSNNRRADCLIKLPNPPGPIVVDAKFPLESYHAPAISRERNGSDGGYTIIRAGHSEACQRHSRPVHRSRRDGGVGADVPSC